MYKSTLLFSVVVLSLVLGRAADGYMAPDYTEAVASSLKLAGSNANELEAALRQVPRRQREGMEFLIAYMPQKDLQTLTATFLLEHVEYAYKAWQESPWRDSVSRDIFLNNILPYSSITEKREAWRKDFYHRFQQIVKNAETPGAAAVKLNQEIFRITNVKYSTARKRPDQAPSETMESGIASCSGLSVMLIDACRSVGIPARFVGTPMWANKSGNHSWVEVWSDGWHFTGACEPAGDDLDKGWFLGRAAQAERDSPLHAIYAVSYKPTRQLFPVPWAPRADWVWAVNVTDRYTKLKEDLPAGVVQVMLSCLDVQGERVAAKVVVQDKQGNVIYQGTCNDGRFDANDHLTIRLDERAGYVVNLEHENQISNQRIRIRRTGQLFTFELTP